jgi:hypothetical protein
LVWCYIVFSFLNSYEQQSDSRTSNESCSPVDPQIAKDTR